MSSVLGTILDPAADKALMTTLTVTLTMQDMIPGKSVLSFIGTTYLKWSFFVSTISCHYPGSRRYLDSCSLLHSLLLLTTPSTCPPITKVPVAFSHFHTLQKTFARYWDFSLPSAEVRPTYISKVKMVTSTGHR